MLAGKSNLFAVFAGNRSRLLGAQSPEGLGLAANGMLTQNSLVLAYERFCRNFRTNSPRMPM